jgi:hypothetical protein
MVNSIFRTLVLVAIIIFKGNAQSLDTFLETALKNSPLLHDYNNQVISGRLDSLLLLSTSKPQVNQISQIMYPPSGPGWGFDESITNGGNYSAVMNITKPLFNKKQISGQLQSINLLNQTIRLNMKIAVIDLKKIVTIQYITAFSDFSQHQFNLFMFDQLTKEQTTVKALVDKGVYQMTDFLNLQVLISSQRIAISQSFIQLRNDFSLLNFICGIDGHRDINLIKPEITVQNNSNPEISPLFAQFRIDSLKNENSRLLVDLNYRPRLNVFADAGFNAISPENVPHNFGAGFGVNFSVPIYDGKQRKLQYDKISLAENTRIYYKKFYSSQYKLQSDQLNSQLKLTDNLINDIRNQLLEQERLIELYRMELENGIVRFLDYLTVINNYTATRNTFLITEMSRLQIINQLNYLK